MAQANGSPSRRPCAPGRSAAPTRDSRKIVKVPLPPASSLTLSSSPPTPRAWTPAGSRTLRWKRPSLEGGKCGPHRDDLSVTRSSRREENLSSTAEQHEANELEQSRESSKCADSRPRLLGCSRRRQSALISRQLGNLILQPLHLFLERFGDPVFGHVDLLDGHVKGGGDLFRGPFLAHVKVEHLQLLRVELPAQVVQGSLEQGRAPLGFPVFIDGCRARIRQVLQTIQSRAGI